MTPIVTFIAILITSQTHTHANTRTHACIRSHMHSKTPRHLLRDTRLFFLIKEIALLCWLFYLMPWLPLCAPHQAVTDTRRRATGLIGAWDARGGAARLGGRRGKPLMGSRVFGSSLSSLSGYNATHLLVCFLFLWLSNHLHKTTLWFVKEPLLQMENRFSFKISITEWMQMPARRCDRP